jgi:hypothetical protein
MVTREIARIEARPLAILSERKERPHLLDGQAKIATAANEGEPRHILLAIGALASREPVRARQQTDVLVIADRGRVGPSAARQGPNSQPSHRRGLLPMPLEPQVT